MLRKVHNYKNLLEPLFAAPPERPFVTMWHGDDEPRYETYKFGQFFNLVQGYASFYHEHGLRPGNTVVLIMAQGISLMAAFAGAMLLGAIPSILAYPTFKIDPEKYRQGLSGVTHNIKAHLVIVDDDLPEDLLEYIASPLDYRLVQIDQKSFRPDVEQREWPEPQGDDLAFLQHSSGTTGLQKGVAITHGAALRQIGYLVDPLCLSGEDCLVSWLPLYHDMGLIACFILPLVCHLHVVMEDPTYWVLRPGSILDIIKRFRATLCWLPNFAFQFLARRVPEAERRQADLSSLKAIVNCSEPVRLQSMEEFYQCYRSYRLSRAALQTSYALAENTFAVTQSRLDGSSSPSTIWLDANRLMETGKVELVPTNTPNALPLVSSGKCLPENFVRVVGENGEDLGNGRVGEIYIRSHCLFQGYYNRPDLTEEKLSHGWFQTGDNGFLWQDELYVLGRKDDIIIIGGKNLYPQDIEEIVCRHASIKDGRAVAVGLYNPELGTQELIVIAEVLRSELLRQENLQNEIRRAILSEIGVAPRHIHLVQPQWIVKSSAGKPARSTNLQKFLREHKGLASS